MRCLTDTKVSTWLSENGIPEDPYYKGGDPASSYTQIEVSRDHLRADSFVRHCFNGILGAGPCLIHVTDWSLYHPSEMIVIDGLRGHHGESRRLIDASGHLLDPEETETAIALFSLCVSFGWTCYLYSAAGQCTLLNWEGELIDFWTGNAEKLARFKDLLKDFQFRETSPPS